MKIGIYTRGSNKLGMGHVFRCLALGDALLKRWPQAQLSFEMQNHVEGLEAVQKRFPGRVRECPETRAPYGQWDVLIVDRLEVSVEEMADLKKRAKLLVSIDDAGYGHFVADIAIEMLYECKVERPEWSRTLSYGGLAYNVMGGEFSNVPYTVRDTVTEVLVTQGASDPHGSTPDIVLTLKEWTEANPAIRLNVHVGPAFKHRQLLDSVAAQLRPGALRLHSGIADMPAFFGSMDLAVSAIGVSAMELAAVGVPTVLATRVPFELETGKKLEDAGAALLLGYLDASALVRLPHLLDRLARDKIARERLSSQARAAVDGNALGRVLDVLAEHLPKDVK